MKRTLKTLLIAGLLFCGILGIGYYSLWQINFIEHNPEIVEENVKRWNNTILSAEYRDGADHCKVDLVDTVNIEIDVGDKLGGTILSEKYRLINDTIIIIGGIKHAGKYLNSDKFLIKEKKLLFKIDQNGGFDTISFMTVKFNKIKL